MPKPFALSRLRRSASFRRLISLSTVTFARMLVQLRGPWTIAQGNKRRSGRSWEVGGLEDHLLIMLLYYRCYVTQEFIGFFYGVDRSVICRAIKHVESLAKPLFSVHRKPVISRKEAEALMVDCTEQPIQRPGGDAAQRLHYSGKKKRHTLKTEYVVTAQGRIASMSPSHSGSRHDLTIRRDGPVLPAHARVHADSAYQGYDNDHPNLDIPYKKPKNATLAEEERHYNRGLGSFRVAVEH